MDNQKAHILLVEDEDDLREVIADVIEGFGYIVDTAENGQQGLEKAMAKTYHAILSDIRMPEKNGLEMLESLRKAGKETPVLFLTAFNEQKYMVEALRLGALDFLKKPFDEKQLVETLAKAAELGKTIENMETELAEIDGAAAGKYKEMSKALMKIKYNREEN